MIKICKKYIGRNVTFHLCIGNNYKAKIIGLSNQHYTIEVFGVKFDNVPCNVLSERKGLIKCAWQFLRNPGR